MRSNADDICEARHGGAPTSVEANPTQERKRILVDRCFGYIMEHGSATVDELSAAFNLTPNVISGRISEMKRAGILRESGERRPTRSGRNAAVIVRVK